MSMFKHLPTVVIGTITALAIAGWAAAVSLSAEERSRQQATLSTNVLNDLRLIQSSLLDAETGQRGYILTGNPTYLAPYTSGRDQFPKAMTGLKDRLSGIETEQQTTALEELQLLGANKFAELAKTIELFDNNQKDEALALINTNAGQRFMDDVRSLIDQLKTQEQIIFQEASAAAARVHDRTATVLIVTAIIIVFLIAILVYTLLRSQRLDRTEDLLAEVTLHRDRSITLAQELSHRTKNMFGIVNSIVRMTGRTETDSKTAIKKISDRISALSRAHSLTTTGDPDQEIDLKELVEVTLQPYDTQARRYSISGKKVAITSSTLTPLGLILHELATNAMKYGAWSEGGSGEIFVSWTPHYPAKGRERRLVTFLWRERIDRTDINGGPSENPTEHTSSGFGSRMIQTSVQQLEGELHQRWDDGMVVEFTFKAERENQTES